MSKSNIPPYVANTVYDGQYLIDFKFENLTNYTEKNKKFLLETMRRLIDVVNSVQYRERFMQLKPDPGLMLGYSIYQCYNILQSGYSNFDKKVDYMLNYQLSLFYENSGTLGSTMVRQARTRTNLKFYKVWEDKLQYNNFGGHLRHEYDHTVGFMDRRWFNLRTNRKSLPYLDGQLVNQMIYQVMQNQLVLFPLKGV